MLLLGSKKWHRNSRNAIIELVRYKNIDLELSDVSFGPLSKTYENHKKWKKSPMDNYVTPCTCTGWPTVNDTLFRAL